MHRFLLLSLALLAGCVSSHAERLGEADFPARPAHAPVYLYEALDDVPHDYVKVAIVIGDGSSEASWGSVFDDLRDRARSVGADGLVLAGFGVGTGGFDESSPRCDDKRVRALAIRFADASR